MYSELDFPFFKAQREGRESCDFYSELEFEFEATSLILGEMVSHETHMEWAWLKGFEGAVSEPSATAIAENICYLQIANISI